ncbi:MAG: C25 family peptidase propeptide domain-containing protein, partial [Candidatus Hodarchaeota archaeon]
MKYKFLIVLNLLIFCTNFIVYSIELNEAKGIDLIVSTNNSVTIKFQPKFWKKDTLNYQGEEYIKLDFFNATFEGEKGKPLIPVMPLNIGIPLDAEVSYTIIESHFDETSGKLLPQPDVIRKNGIDFYQYVEEKSIYYSDKVYPTQLVEVSEPAFFRNQRMVTVSFKPVQFTPALKKIKLYHSITLRIDFIGSAKVYESALLKSNSVEDRMYKEVILNYSQAKFWRNQRTKSLKKFHSKYNSNPWLKIFVKDDGIYKITGSMLVDLSIDIKSINPSTLKIYNNGGRELNRNINAMSVDSLIENAILVNDGGDRIFDILDDILFYGKSVNNWSYNSDIH